MKKITSIIIVLSMILSMFPTAAFAAEADHLCEHHAEHTAECGYVEGVSDCAYHCDVCLGHDHGDEVTEEDTEPAPVCDCGTDDGMIHATTCAVYVAPENPVCYCAEKCTEVNEWCDVCGFDYTACTGTDTAVAYAEGDKVSVTINGETTYYTSIKDAVAKANESGNATITLLQDTTTGERLDITNSATLDLNGNTLSCTAYFADDYETMVAITTNNTKLTIIDSVGGGKLDGTGTDYALMLGEPGAYTARSASAYIDGSTVSGSIKTVSGTSMTVSGSTVESNSVVATIDMTNETTLNVFNSQILNTHSSSTAPAIDNSGTLTITDSTVSGSIGVDNRGTANISGNTNITGTVCSVKSWVESQDSTLTITGGSYTGGIDISGGTATISGGSYTGGIVVSGGTATISDGTITESRSNKENAVEVSGSAELTISGGTFSAIAGETYDTGVYVHDGGTVKIIGGTITSRAYGVYNDGGSATITGGTISGGTVDLQVVGSDSILNLTLDEGKTVGATFPGGITAEGITLAELLATDTAAYWGVVDGKDTMLTVADDAATGITDKGDITIRAICDHKDVKLDYITTETTHTPVCSVCNWTIGEATEHTGGTATCQDPAVCEACGVSYGDLDANNHSPAENVTYTDNGDGTHSFTCVCGTTVTEDHTLDVTTGKCGACGADMTVVATVTDGTNIYYAADAATLNQAVTAILETGSRTFTVELPADAEAGMITAIRRAICDTEGVADGSIHLTLKGVTSIPGTTNWDGVAFGPGDIYDEAGEIVDQELVTQLASINLPDVTEIGAQAFYFCENLVSVSAPKAQTIGAQALGYTALTSVEFPELTTIPTDMFSGTWTLSSAKFPKVTTIEQGGLLVGGKFTPENNPTPFPLELTAEGNITFNGSNHFNIASQNYSGKVDLVLCCDKKDAVTFHDDGTATWQVREDLSYTFKSITFKHSYVDGKCTACGEDCAHTGGTATCTTLAVCENCGVSYGEVDTNNHDETVAYVNGFCPNCDAFEPATDSDSNGYYDIDNAGKLYWFAVQVNSGKTNINGELKANIVINKDVLAEMIRINPDPSRFRLWTPIGTEDNAYIGDFCGLEHTVSGLYFNDSKAGYVGLFGYVASGMVNHVGVIDSYFNGSGSVGGVVGHNEGTVEYAYSNSYVGGNVCIGGVVGDNRGTVMYTYNLGSISGLSEVGGVVGANYNIVKNCYNIVSISGNSLFGDVVGDNFGTLENCYYPADAETDELDGTTAKTWAQFKSGEVAYLLGRPFGQNIGTNSVPVLYGETVYYGYTSCGDTVAKYTNDETISAEKPDHTQKPTFTVNGDGTHSAFYSCCGTTVTEDHTLTYTAKDNVITAACSANCGYSETATISAENATYNGTEQKTAAVTYSDGWKSDELNVSYENNVNAGTATASITIGEVTASVEFTIEKATVTVTADAKSKPYGTDNPTLTYTSEGLLGDDALTGALETTATKTSSVGEYDITVGSLANSNYTIDFVGAKLTITKAAAPEIQWPTAVALTYGQKLSDSALTSEDKNGTFAWQDGSIVPTVTNDGYVVVYTPKDTDNYDYTVVELTETIPVTVSKVSATVTAAPTPNTLTYTGEGQYLINAGEANGGTMQYSTDNQTWSTTIPQGTAAGEYTVYYKVVGDENHSDTDVQSVEVKIGQLSVAEPTVSGTYTYTGSEQAVTLTGVESYMTIVSGNKATNAGSYEVVITLDGNHKWADGSDGKVQWSIAKAEPKAEDFVFQAPSNLTYDGETKSASVSVRTGIEGMGEIIAVMYYNADSSPAVEKQPISAGNYFVQINVAEGENYTEKTFFRGEDWVFSIGKAKAEITVNTTPITVTYGETVTLPVATANVGTVTCDKTAADLENAGTYTVTYTVAGTANYDGDTETVTVTIKPKTITEADVELVGTLTYTGEEQTQEITVTEGIAYTVTGNKATNVGTYTLTVTASGNYTGSVTKQWSIGEAAAVVLAAPTANELTYTGEAQNLVTEGTSNDGTMVYSLTEDGQYTETIPTGLGAGDYTVWYYVAGDANHSDSAKASVNVEISRAELTITAKNNAITYGDAPAANGVEYSGFVNAESEAVLAGTLAYGFNYEQYGDVGTYKITPSGVTSGDYEIAFVSGDLSVTAKGLSVKAEAKTKIYGETDPELTYQVDGLVGGDALTGTLERTSGENVGAYAIKQGTLTAGGNYTITYTGAALTINPKAITEADVELKGTLTYNGSEQIQQITGKNGITCDVTGNKANDVGTYELTVTGTGNYTGEVKLSYTVAKKPISVVWENTNLVYNGSAQSPVAKLAGVVTGDDVQAVVNGSGTNAGTYDATVSLSGTNAGNYALTGSTKFTIARAPVTFKVSNNSVEEGKAIAVTVISEPAGVGHTVTYRQNSDLVTPSAVGEYDIYVEITDSNYRHAASANGNAIKIGVLTLYEGKKPATYTLSYAPGEGSGTMAAEEAALAGTIRILPECTFTAPKDSNGNDMLFAGWTDGSVTYKSGEKLIQPEKDVTLTALWVAEEHNISGMVMQFTSLDPNAPKEYREGVVITLVLGSKQIAQAITDENGNYSFEKCLLGTYNLIAEYEGIRQTIKVVLGHTDQTGKEINLPAGKTNTTVDVEPGTPDVVVGGLDELMKTTDQTVFTEADKHVVESGGEVEIKMEVKENPAPEKKDELESKAEAISPVAEIGIFVDLDLTKTVTEANENTGTSAVITEAGKLLENIIFLPGHLQGKNQYYVFREHDGRIEELDELRSVPTGTTEGFVVDSVNHTITIYSMKYSTYAIAYTDLFTITLNANGGKVDVERTQTGKDGTLESLPTPTRGGYTFKGWFTAESGGTEVTTDTVFNADKIIYAQWTMDYVPTPSGGEANKITVTTPENGTVSADLNSAKEGTIVTITVKPDEGYVLDKLIVTDAKGDERKVTAKGNNKYSFVMPDSKVTIKATFVSTNHPCKNFSDLSMDAWYHNAVDYALVNGLMNGVGGGKFDPNGTTNRAMIVTILWRLEGEPSVNDLMQFEDVAPDVWYTEAVRWAASEEIVTGYSSAEFGPMDPITREQLATILFRYAKYKGYDVGVGENTKIRSYNDAFNISDWADPAMQWACGAGLIQGDAGNLMPQNKATRAQVATILQRFCEEVKDQ